MKENTFRQLLHILDSIFHGKGDTDGYDCNDIMKEANKQALTGIVADYLTNSCKNLTHEKKLHYISIVLQIERKNKWMNQQQAWLADLFRKNGIRHTVMKGQTVARFYPNPLLRMPGDIDVYVAKNDFRKACALIEHEKYTKTDFTMLHATYCQKGKAEIEIHFAIQKLQWLPHYRYLQSITLAGVDNAKPEYTDIDGRQISILPKELEVLLYTVHAFNHVVNGGLGLRQIIDWMLCIEKTGDCIDIKLLKEYLVKTGMSRMFRVLGYICSEYLGMSLKEPFWMKSGLHYNHKDIKLGERLLSWVEECGNFGHSMNLSKVGFYMLFLKICLRFCYLSRKEMFIYPFMKIKRGITGENHLRK
ncbi:MAG: nucleotidyltransferase family protein [Prevotella sp.]|nr:nucleotidyltransferase family protein [Prevotella sp.]